MPLPYLWSALQSAKKPIVIYGMGNGAEKVLNACAEHQISIAGIFASDDFVRYQTFRSFTVKHYADLVSELGEDLIILIAFSAFTDELLERIHSLCEKHTVYAPDFDVFADRYPARDFIETYRTDMEKAYALLGDDRSRDVFRLLTEYKITGLVDPLFKAHNDREACVCDLLRLHEHERYLDLGAYRGDTVEEFLHVTHGRFDSIDAFEPDPKNRQKLTEYVESLPHSEIRIHGAAVSDKSGTLTFTGKGGRASHLAENGYDVPAIAIDDLQLSPTYIKMDVEGAERAALLGARKTLRRCRPKLLVSLYHHIEDYITLPLLIDELVGGGYKYHLRMHPYIPAWDIMLYAVPEELTNELDPEKI